MQGSPWTETEVRAAIAAYFKMQAAQEAGSAVNKSAVYRDLAAAHPVRSTKSWEAKFQNISAVLYEEQQPFIDGLAPRPNYQALLRALVVDRLRKTGRSQLKPHKILEQKLRTLRKRGFLPVKESKGARSDGRYGLTLEHHLGIPQNSSTDPDFMGIELKTKTKSSVPQTLFSQAPSRWVACANPRELIEAYGRADPGKGRRGLYTCFNRAGGPFGFSLDVRGYVVRVKNSGKVVLEYEGELVEQRLLAKHGETAYISVSKQPGSLCRFDEMMYCERPSILRFLRLVKEGKLFLNFSMHLKDGVLRNHGITWRILDQAKPELYLHSSRIDLSA